MDIGRTTKRTWLSRVFIIAFAVGVSILGVVSLPDVYAQDESQNAPEAKRTIMYYEDGCDPETTAGAASANLVEAMNAEFDNQQIRFIVITGGANQWQMESEYLRDQDGNPIKEISNEYNQIWELTGKADGEEHGYMTLLDGDGVTGDGPTARKSEDELMNDPTTLTAFIDWVYERYPAKHYNLMFWDHGHGPAYGYGVDEHRKDESGEYDPSKMPVADIVSGISASDFIENEGKFDIIEFDCCMMGNFEIALAMQDYTDYYLGCPDVDPFPSLDYTAWLNYLGENPEADNKELGRQTVNIYVDWFEQNPGESSINKAVTLCMVDTEKLKNSGIVGHMKTIADILRREAAEKNFYDEIRSTKDDFQYAFPTLQSLETLAEQLGINLYELESLEDPYLSNDYTEAAKAVCAILSDEEIIYAGSTSFSKEDKTVIGRNLTDGNVEIREPVVPLSGLTAFFVTNGYYGEYASYDDAMQKLEGVLKDDEVKNFISTYRKAVIDFKLIFEAGAAVSAIVDNGTPASDVNLNMVKDYWRSQETPEQEIVWDLISPLIESRGAGTDAWLSEIIDVQKNEVIDHDKVDIRLQSEDGRDYYRLNVKDTKKRLIDVPKVSLTAKMDNPPEGLFTDEVYMEYEGEQVFDGLDPEEVESFLDIIAGKKSSYRIPRFDGTWYAVEDASGTKHIASIGDDKSVYASFTFESGAIESGMIVFDENGNVKNIVVDNKPIDIDSIVGSVSVELMNSPKAPIIAPISTPFDIKNCKLIKAPISELGISKVDVKLSIADMYKFKHEIKPELKFDPNGGKWTDGSDAVMEYEADLETEFDIIDAPKRKGYTFVCWKGSEYQPGDKYMVAEDHIFTAEWKKNDSGDDKDDPIIDDNDDSDDPTKDGTSKAKKSKGAKTGDESNLTIWLMMLIGSAGAIIALAKKLSHTDNRH